jgi:hypothetical protein
MDSAPKLRPLLITADPLTRCKCSRHWSPRLDHEEATPKKKAPVQLTAGTGFGNENCVAARFLLDLLAGTDSLSEKFGKIDREQF